MKPAFARCAHRLNLDVRNPRNVIYWRETQRAKAQEEFRRVVLAEFEELYAEYDAGRQHRIETAGTALPEKDQMLQEFLGAIL